MHYLQHNLILQFFRQTMAKVFNFKIYSQMSHSNSKITQPKLTYNALSQHLSNLIILSLKGKSSLIQHLKFNATVQWKLIYPSLSLCVVYSSTCVFLPITIAWPTFFFNNHVPDGKSPTLIHKNLIQLSYVTLIVHYLNTNPIW